MEWQKIETAPKDGTWFRGKCHDLEHDTQWGKTSHVPLYGWCYFGGDHGDVENITLWQPIEWQPLPPQ